MAHVSKTHTRPSATVIIPTSGRWEVIEGVLGTLSAVPDDPPWELLMVANGPAADPPAEVLECFESRLEWRLLWHKELGANAARNRGAVEARGDILIFLDDDIVPANHFISDRIRLLEEQPGFWVTGPKLDESFGGELSGFEQYFEQVAPGWSAEASVGTGPTDFLCACNFAVRRAEFMTVGGFLPTMPLGGQDTELMLRVRRRLKIRIYEDPSLAVRHIELRRDLESYLERQRSRARTHVLLWTWYGEATGLEDKMMSNGLWRWCLGRPRFIPGRILKMAFSSRFGSKLLRAWIGLLERDDQLTPALVTAYRLAEGAAIYSGIQAGLREHGHRRREPPTPASLTTNH